MLRFSKTKPILLMLGLLFSTMVCGAYGHIVNDGSNITIQTTHANGAPKDMYIQAAIDGHYLTVVFTENLGQVAIAIESSIYGEVSTQSTPTPNGVIIYISNTGSYTVTFTLPNGDEYYGEFDVTDN